jgi:hypothetical protein
LQNSDLDSLSEKPVYVSLQEPDDGSGLEYLYRIGFEDGCEGGAGTCDSIEEAVRKVKYYISSFQSRNDVSHIGPGHVDLDDGTGKVEVQEILKNTNLSDFFES